MCTCVIVQSDMYDFVLISVLYIQMFIIMIHPDVYTIRPDVCTVWHHECIYILHVGLHVCMVSSDIYAAHPDVCGKFTSLYDTHRRSTFVVFLTIQFNSIQNSLFSTQNIVNTTLFSCM